MATAQPFNLYNFLTALRSYEPWKVALELIIIAAVLFWVVRFLQGTRGARLLRGILVVLIGGYVAVRVLERLVGLIALGYLYNRFLLFASVATVVVFQPELRRALMRLGDTRLFGSGSGGVQTQVDEIVEAAKFCSKRKIGALIALERDVALAGSTEGATNLDAALSSRLLTTIFWPNSPLHDLGVIVSKNRVAYAGVQFPLAESGEIEKDLGSRHRAAVGMSADSDALVIVVSEETGAISIAEDGKLRRKLTPERLREELEDGLDNDPDDPAAKPDDANEGVGFSDAETDAEAAKDTEDDGTSGKGSKSSKSSGKSAA